MGVIGPPYGPSVVVKMPADFVMVTLQFTDEPPILLAVPEVFPVAHAGVKDEPQLRV